MPVMKLLTEAVKFLNVELLRKHLDCESRLLKLYERVLGDTSLSRNIMTMVTAMYLPILYVIKLHLFPFDPVPIQ